MGRFFNTAGPCQPDIHYTLDPMSRLASVRQLVDGRKYFILHAPRQTGKTTTMISFVNALNREGKYIALYINVEPAQAVRNNVEAANGIFLSTLEHQSRLYLPSEYRPSADCLNVPSMDTGLSTCLRRWCAELPKPLVLFIDEADALIGDSLLSLLRQLRSGYSDRPHGFPHTLALIGLRDLRDYRIFSDATQSFVIGGSAFNIKDESLTMGNFSPEEVRTLYAQHTAETGQQFTEEALDLVFQQTWGQPWLVNALGREMCFGAHKVPDLRTVVADDVYRAGEVLIQRRDTHLDHLGDKLTEPRVARVVDIILSSANPVLLESIPQDDLQYVMDLGLVRRTPDGLGISNPIYREVVPRQLTWVQQEFLPQNPAWYVKPDGKLDMELVLERFFEFYRENGEMLSKHSQYPESAYHLAFFAWMQRIINGGGYIRREYAAGLGFVDMVAEFSGEKFVFELKTERNFKREKALKQVTTYARKMSVSECYLMVFRKEMAAEELVGMREVVEYEGVKVNLIWV